MRHDRRLRQQLRLPTVEVAVEAFRGKHILRAHLTQRDAIGRRDLAELWVLGCEHLARSAQAFVMIAGFTRSGETIGTLFGAGI